jgi:hypothetical protein
MIPSMSLRLFHYLVLEIRRRRSSSHYPGGNQFPEQYAGSWVILFSHLRILHGAPLNL